MNVRVCREVGGRERGLGERVDGWLDDATHPA